MVPASAGAAIKNAHAKAKRLAARSAAAKTFRISITPPATDPGWNNNYFAYDKSIPANDTICASNTELVVQKGGIIYVYASSADLSFQAFGYKLL